MNSALVLRILGAMLLFLAGALLLPLPFSFYFRDGAAAGFLAASALSAVAGGLCLKYFHSPKELSVREGFAVVTFCWTFYALFGALPFVFSGAVPNYLDAVFETMSGFTTTGATIITDLAVVPQSIVFWRALTQWLGGMGIIVLSLAILPMLGVGGMQLFKAEFPGPTTDRLKPRIQDTAKLLWGVYVLLTVVETVLLLAGGMSFFEALSHAFATVATGGFATRDASVGAYGSAYLDGVITFFMFLGGINFYLHFQMLRGRLRDFYRNEEFLVYLGLAVGVTVLIMALNHGTVYASLADNLRYSAFQVVSILTTTGFATADYEGWPTLAQYLLVFLMFVGGCAGSTAGGIKIARLLLLFKHAQVQIYRLIHPRAVRLVKLGNTPVDRDVMQSILGFLALYIVIFVIASFLMALAGLDLVTAGASVIATLGNIGPGLGAVGPTDNYANIAPFGKTVLITCMLLGRLELYTVLVLFFPSFWKK
ncbi:MAG: TrkH family potassium uptake protein [Desulfuromonadales bacterium]